jgi:hypothetical protein
MCDTSATVANAVHGDFWLSPFFLRQFFIELEDRKLFCRKHIILLPQGGLFRHFVDQVM